MKGLNEYVKIKEALRDYEGKAQVTEEDLTEVEREAEEHYQEFLKEQATKK